MEKGFTLVEVIILFVIFITVAILVIPLSVEDAVTTKHTTKWQHVQSRLSSIPINLMNSKNYKTTNHVEPEDFVTALNKVLPLKDETQYKIKYMNGAIPDNAHIFDKIYETDNGATIGYKWLDDTSVKGEDKIYGILMYDVNGKRGPNVWGKDIFGITVYDNKIEPLGKNFDPVTIETDCSRLGTGVFCSAYYLNGGRQKW